MADVLFTLPGKIGDNFFRLFIAHRYALEQHAPVDLALDLGSRCMVSLLNQQSWTDRVFTANGIDRYEAGGQPFDFGPPENLAVPPEGTTPQVWQQVYHLGYRRDPGPNLIRGAWAQSGVPLKEPRWLGHSAPILWKPLTITRLVIHMDADENHLHPYTRERNQNLDVTLWPVWEQLLARFTSVVFIGTHAPSALERYQRYLERGGPQVSVLYDEGRLERVVALLGHSLLIGSYSSMWALGCAMRLDQIVLMDDRHFHPARIHDGCRLVFPYDSGTLMEHVAQILALGYRRGLPAEQYRQSVEEDRARTLLAPAPLP
jgi:hypothetical protein